MLGWQACLIVAALAAPNEIEIVKFTSEYCAPCRAMEPVLDEARGRGYRVQEIDWEQQPELAKRHQVKVVPTLLLVHRGQIVDRIEGAVAAETLWARLAQIDRPGPALAPNRPPAQRPQTSAVAAASPFPAAVGENETERRAMAASVRLRVEDETGQSYGSGTIVDVHGTDALILTCGHLFRDSNGRGQITVQLIAHGAAGQVEGQLIRFDLKRDLALVGIRSTLPLTAVPVAGAEYHVANGQRLFSVGCNHGQEATVMRGPLRAVNKYLGPENLVVGGQPVDGRSGGGLFSYDGKLVGVCNAADPESNEGLYAAFASIHRHLDDAMLSFVYGTRNDATEQLANNSATRGRALPPIPRDDRSTPADFGSSAALPVDAVALAAFAGEQPPLATGAAGGEPNGAEVICIIRPKNQPDARSQVVVLERPSREFIQRLNQERSDQVNRQATQLRVSQRPRSATGPPAAAVREPSGLGRRVDPIRVAPSSS